MSVIDDLAPLSFVERVARLEERNATLTALIDEVRHDQKVFAETVARASGGVRVLLLLGGLAGLIGVARNLLSWGGELLSSGHGGLR